MFGLFKKNVIRLLAPLSGKAVPLESVPDEVFSQKLVGDGIAIEPTDGLLLSPCNGRILKIFPTNHAVIISSEEGIEILIHLGLDTVELKGEGFERLAEDESIVKTGDPIIRMDMERIHALGKRVITPIIILNKDKAKNIKIFEGEKVACKDLLIELN